MNLTRLYRIIKANKKSILFFATFTALTVFLIGSIMVKYEAKVTVVIQPLSSRVIDNPTNPQIGVISSPLMSILYDWKNSYINLLTSHKVIEEVARRISLTHIKQLDLNEDGGLIEKLKDIIRVIFYGRKPVRGTRYNRSLERLKQQVSAKFYYNSSTMQITVLDKDPIRAVKIANTLLDVFLEYSRDLTTQAADQALIFIEKQLTYTREQIKVERENQYKLKKQNGVYKFTDLDNEIQRISGKLINFEDQYEANREEIEIIRKKLERIDKKLSQHPEFQKSSYTIDTNQSVQKLKERLFNLKIDLKQLLIDYKPESLQVSIIKKQIEMVENEIKAELKKILSREVFQINPIYQNLLNAKISNESDLDILPFTNNLIENRIEKYKKQLLELDRALKELSVYDLKISSLQNQENDLIANLNKTQMLKARGASEIQILENAYKPRYPVLRGFPLLNFVAFGFFAAILLAAGLIAFKTEWSGVIVDERDFDLIDSNIPIISVSPIKKNKTPFNSNHNLVDPKLTKLQSYSKDEPSLQQLAIRLEHGPFKNIRASKCIGVCSTKPVDKQPLMTLNFGLTLVSFDYRVIIMDLNYMSPNLHKQFNIVPKKGIADYLHTPSEKQLNELIHATTSEKLSIIPWNPKDRYVPKLFEGDVFAMFLSQLKKQFDYVLIDFPPVLYNPKCLPLTGNQEINGIILFVKMFQTRREDIVKTIRNIESVNGRIIACICGQN